MRNHLVNTLKLAFGIGLIVALFLSLEDPEALWQQILEANKVLLLAGVVCYSSAVAVSGLKWGILLRAAGIHIPTSQILSYQWVAEFFNNFLPAQVGGDIIRGYSLASDTSRAADAAASVLIDRFIGLIVFMSAAAVASAAMLIWGKPDGTSFSSEGLYFMRFAALGSVAFSLLLLSIVVALLSRRLKSRVEWLLTHLPLADKLVPIWQKLAAAFDVYRSHARALWLTALGSLLIVLLTSLNIWLISEAIQPGSISLLEVLTINPIIVFALLIVPFSPGGLGVRQISFAGLFYMIGAGYELGTAVGLLQQFIGYLVSIPGGLLWMRGGKERANAAIANSSPGQVIE